MILRRKPRRRRGTSGGLLIEIAYLPNGFPIAYLADDPTPQDWKDLEKWLNAWKWAPRPDDLQRSP